MILRVKQWGSTSVKWWSTARSPVISQVKGYPYEVRLPAGVGVTGVILSDQVKGLDWEARGAEFICTLPEQTLAEILAKLRILVS